MAVFHVWFGRSLIVLGIINGGLGLVLAANTTAGEILYGVIAGLMGIIYIAVVVMASRKDQNTFGMGGLEEKGTGGGTPRGLGEERSGGPV